VRRFYAQITVLQHLSIKESILFTTTTSLALRFFWYEPTYFQACDPPYLSSPRELGPPREDGRIVIVLDMDETLLHGFEKYESVVEHLPLESILYIASEKYPRASVRPGVCEFLMFLDASREVGEVEVHVFSAGSQGWVDPALDALLAMAGCPDLIPHSTNRRYEDSVSQDKSKDLTLIERDLRKVIHFGNAKYEFAFAENGWLVPALLYTLPGCPRPKDDFFQEAWLEKLGLIIQMARRPDGDVRTLLPDAQPLERYVKDE